MSTIGNIASRTADVLARSFKKALAISDCMDINDYNKEVESKHKYFMRKLQSLVEDTLKIQSDGLCRVRYELKEPNQSYIYFLINQGDTIFSMFDKTLKLITDENSRKKLLTIAKHLILKLEEMNTDNAKKILATAEPLIPLLKSIP